MTEEGQTQEAAPVEQATEAVEKTAVENIQQEKPSIMMDKDVASTMASQATDVNAIESGDPVEQGLDKGMKMSGVAGDPVAAPSNQIAPVSAQEGKTSARVSPVADVPADAQLNTEGSEPSVTPDTEEPKEEVKEEPKEEPKEEVTEEPKEEVTEEPKEEVKEEPKEEVKEEPKEEIEEETEAEEPKEEPEAEEETESKDTEESKIPEGAKPEGEEAEEAEAEEEYTPFGDPLRNVTENMSKEVPIDRKTTADSDILLTDIPGKMRIY